MKLLLRSIILVLLNMGMIFGQDEEPINTPGSSLASSSTGEGGGLPNYIIDYIKISSSVSQINAFPFEQCTLISLDSNDEYPYAMYTCQDSNVFKSYYKTSTCEPSSTNITLREEIRASNSIDDGDYESFNCDGDDLYVKIQACSSNNVLIGDSIFIYTVPDVCWYDLSQPDYSYLLQCLTGTGSGGTDTIDDNSNNDDSLQLTMYNLDQEMLELTCAMNDPVTTLTLSLTSTCQSILGNNIKGVIDIDDSVIICQIYDDGDDDDDDDGDGGNTDDACFYSHFYSLLFIIMVFVFFIQ